MGGTDGRDGRQGDMAWTMVISRRSVIHPHNLPALLESEDDERERKGKRGERESESKGERESDGETKVHKMLTS